MARPKYVLKSAGILENFQPSSITSSIMLETGLGQDIAQKITTQVIRKLSILNIEEIPAPLIREMVNIFLAQAGYLDAHHKYKRIGLPVYDYCKFFDAGLKENANQMINPESIDHWTANAATEEYVLSNILTSEMARAHRRGDIHIHMLRYFNSRSFCQQWDVRMILKYGFPPVPWAHSPRSRPARSGVVAATHLAKWFGFMSQELAGGMGYDNFTAMLAPYISRNGTEEERWREAYQIAQAFVFESSQIYASRGAQTPFTSISCTPGVDSIVAGLDAVGPRGVVLGKYADYPDETTMMFDAFTQVFIDGDADGHLFNFPKHEVKYRTEWGEKYKGSYMKVMEEVAIHGTPYFLNMAAEWMPEEMHSQCCRLLITPEGMSKYCNDPDAFDWSKTYMNMGSMQSVSINLPRIAYESTLDMTEFYNILEDRMELARDVLLLKRDITVRNIKNKVTPMCASILPDGNPVFDMRRQSLNIGFVGLNEAVYYMQEYEHELHNPEGFEMGLEILNELVKLCNRFTVENKIKFSLWEQPAESASQRFAMLDWKYFPEMQKPTTTPSMSSCIRGIPGTPESYYTNSGHIRYDADIPLYQRIEMQGQEHPIIQGGVITHIFLGEAHPDTEALWNLTKRICHNTQNAYFAYTKDFTKCMGCNQQYAGTPKTCPKCGAPE